MTNLLFLLLLLLLNLLLLLLLRDQFSSSSSSSPPFLPILLLLLSGQPHLAEEGHCGECAKEAGGGGRGGWERVLGTDICTIWSGRAREWLLYDLRPHYSGRLSQSVLSTAVVRWHRKEKKEE